MGDDCSGAPAAIDCSAACWSSMQTLSEISLLNHGVWRITGCVESCRNLPMPSNKIRYLHRGFEQIFSGGGQSRDCDGFGNVDANSGGTIKLGAVHVAKVLKLYGRNSHLLDLLTGLTDRFTKSSIDGLSVVMQGRWFAIRVQ